MASKVPEVIGGINKIIDDLKSDELSNPEAKNLTTIVDFSSHTDFTVIYDKTATQDLKLIDNTQYSARGMTALYDAIGKASMLIPKGSTDVMVTIFTDGLENDSKEYKQTSIKALIESKEELGWVITYMGTSHEAMLQASEIGLTEDKVLRYSNSKEGTSYAMDSIMLARKKYTISKMQGKDVDDIFDKKNS